MHFSTHHNITRFSKRVKSAVIVILVILMLQGLCSNAYAQHSQVAQTTNQSRDERIQQILKILEPDDTLRLALERGYRGDGRHYIWMDKMQRQGVKQASFRIHFHWGKRNKKLKVADVKYLRQYYRFDTAIADQAIVRKIRASGLEQKLRNEILRRAKANLAQRMLSLRSRRICGTLYLNLLDDEILPILDEPPDLDDDCKTIYG